MSRQKAETIKLCIYSKDIMTKTFDELTQEISESIKNKKYYFELSSRYVGEDACQSTAETKVLPLSEK